jgi:hypothetical protein
MAITFAGVKDGIVLDTLHHEEYNTNCISSRDIALNRNTVPLFLWFTGRWVLSGFSFISFQAL